jgi:histidinol-phosphate aminotransferase
MNAITEKGGGTFHGIKLLLCENPLPPLEEAVAAAQAEVTHSNYYTEPYSAPLRQLISAQLGLPERLIHINAGSELHPASALRPLLASRFTYSLRPTYSSPRSPGGLRRPACFPSAISRSISTSW